MMDDSKPKKSQSQATKLVGIVLEEGIDLFHDQLRDPYARVEIGGHPEIMKCRGKSFKHFLAYVYHRAKGSALPSETANSAVNQLASIAIFDGKEISA